MDRFWMVWNPNNRSNPSFKHSTENSAIQEATRLASSNPGEQFIVLAAVAVASNVAVKVERIGEDIPF